MKQAHPFMSSIAAAILAWTPSAAAQAQPADPATYEDTMLALSRVLGASHYLRILCEGREDQRWRDFMRGLMEREPAMSDRLRDAFNAAYREQEVALSACDARAVAREAQLRERGQRLAGALRARNAR